MGRSRGFGSIPCNYNALFRLGFPTAPVLVHLNLAAKNNSRTHYAKGTPSHLAVLRLLVGTRFQVSFTPLTGVLFTFPSRYWFTIGHRGIFSLGGWSRPLPTGFFVPCGTRGIHSGRVRFRVQVFHLLWPCLPALSAISPSPFIMAPTTPNTLRHLVWAVPGSLAATTGITCLFSLPAGTKMFQFPAFAWSRLCIHLAIPTLRLVGFPIRIPPDQSLFGSSPRLVAAYPRPSSLLDA